MVAFTYGWKLNRGGRSRFPTLKEKLLRLEEKRQYKQTLRTLYEKKAHSICGDRDHIFLIKFPVNLE